MPAGLTKRESTLSQLSKTAPSTLIHRGAGLGGGGDGDDCDLGPEDAAAVGGVVELADLADVLDGPAECPPR